MPSQKFKYCLIPFVWNVQYSRIYKYRNKFRRAEEFGGQDFFEEDNSGLKHGSDSCMTVADSTLLHCIQQTGKHMAQEVAWNQ